MAPFVLKFKGNKSFSPFSNLTDGDALTRTWKVCTKVAAHLEQGQRLENLSWRLWHLHNLMVDSDADTNSKSRREFKKLSRHTGERLDRDKNRDISDLQAPKFTAERLRQRAEEKERCRVASEKTAHAMRGRGIRGMQYTFALKPPAATTTTVTATRPKPSTSGTGPRPRRATDAHKDSPDSANLAGRPRSATTTQTASALPTSDIELPPYDPNDADVDTEHDEDMDAQGLVVTGSPDDLGPGQGVMDEADMLALMEDSEASVLRFETLFGGFGPNHLLVNTQAPSYTQPALSYGEAVASVNGGDDVSVGRPTFEIQIEELLSADDDANKTGEKRDEHWSSTDTAANTDVETTAKPRMSRSNTGNSTSGRGYNTAAMGVIGMKPDADSVPLTHAYAHGTGYDEATSNVGTPTTTANFNWGGSGSPPLMPAQSAPTSPAFALRPVRYGQQDNAYPDGIATFNAETYDFAPGTTGVPPLSLPMSSYSNSPTAPPTTNGKRGANNGGHSRAHSTGTVAGNGGFKHPATININTTTSPTSKNSTPTSSPTSRNNSAANNNGGPSATPPPTRGRSGSNAIPLHGNTAPGGVKSECANCGANSTPLWRRGLNDELNCNACGLYCKLHKRPRPKTLRNSGGEGGSRNPGWHAPRGGTGGETEAMGEPVSCYNCHTTATPLWRKDEEGRTLCNACGLYLKLHGERRPSSMKSDVIRKRSRHDARRPGNGNGSSSATPSASPGASRRASPTATSPTLNQDPSSFANSEQHMPYYGPYDYSHAGGSGMMGADEQTYPMSYAPSPGLMFPQSVGYPGQVNYNTQPYYGPFLPNMMDTTGESPNDTQMGNGHSNGITMSPGHTASSGSGQPPVHKKRRMSTADTLASSTSGSERSDGTPSFLDDLANPNVPDPSRASPSATFVPNNYQYTSFSPSLTYPNLPGDGATGNNMSYFHPPMVLPWLHNDMPLTTVGAKPEPIDEPMNSELSMS